MTWQTDPSYVLLMQNRVMPKGMTYMNYEDYMQGKEFANVQMPEHGPYLTLMKQAYPGESIFTAEYRRQIGCEYTAQTFFSRDQSHVAILRKAVPESRNLAEPESAKLKKSQETGNVFDIFNGVNTLDFFQSKLNSLGLGRESQEFVGSIRAAGTCSKFVFSNHYRFCATFSERGFELFDLQKKSSTSINSDVLNEIQSKSEPEVIEAEYQLQQTCLHDSDLSCAFNRQNTCKHWNDTYDKLLALYLGSDDDIYESSWLIFQSKTFSIVHCIKLSSVLGWLKKYEDKDNNEDQDKPIFFEDESEHFEIMKEKLQAKLFQVHLADFKQKKVQRPFKENSIKVHIDSTGQPKDFWQQTHSLISKNGNMAVVYTQNEVYSVDLKPFDFNVGAKKRVKPIFELQGKQSLFFKHGEEDFIFVIKEEDGGQRQLSFTQIGTNKVLQNQLSHQKIDISRFDWNSFQLLEACVLDDSKYTRLIGVRGSQEVLIYEKPPSKFEEEDAFNQIANRRASIKQSYVGNARVNQKTSGNVNMAGLAEEENQAISVETKQFFEDMFPTKLTAIQVPYIAYSTGGRVINIVPLFEPNFVLRYEFKDKDMEQDEEIQKLIFTANEYLYVITRGKKSETSEALTKFFIYEIRVGQEIGSQIENVGKRLSQASKPLIAKQPTKRTETLLDGDQQKKISDSLNANKVAEDAHEKSQVLYKYGPFHVNHPINRNKEKEADLLDAYIFDQDGATFDRCFIFNCEHRLYVHQNKQKTLASHCRQHNKWYETNELSPGSEPIRDFNRINRQNYIFAFDDPSDSKIYHLHVNGKDRPKIEVAYQETSYDVLAVKADYHGFYLMVTDKYHNVYLRVLTMEGKHDITFQQTSFVKIDKNDPLTQQFVDSFYITKTIMDGVLVHNSKMLSQILTDPVMPGIRHIENFLPAKYYEHDGLTLMTSDILTNHTNRKLGLILTLPQTANYDAMSRVMFIVPYLFDNEVALTGSAITQLTWISHAVVEKSMASKSQVPKAFIYQFNSKRWRLSKFNMAGICLQSKTFKSFKTDDTIQEKKQNKIDQTQDVQTGPNDDDLATEKQKALGDSNKKEDVERDDPRNFKILAIHPKEPRFLITPPDKDFYKKMRLVRVNDDFTITTEENWNLDDNNFSVPGEKPGEKKLQLYDLLRNASSSNESQVQFQINSKLDISISIFDLSTGMLKEYALLLSAPEDNSRQKKQEPKLKFLSIPTQIQNTEKAKLAMTEAFKRVLTRKNQTGINEPLLNGQDAERYETLKFGRSQEQQPSGVGVIGSELSDKKVILWSEGQIFYANLDEYRNDQKNVIKLKVVQNLNLPSHGLENHNSELHDFETKIERVICRKEITKEAQTNGNQNEIVEDRICIKVQTGGNEAMVSLFDLENERELNCLCCTKNAEFLFDTDNFCYVFDKDGIKKLSNGESFLEYHVENKETSSIKKFVPDISWGCRMVPSTNGILLLVNDKVVLPYNALSCIYHSKSVKDSSTDETIFYTRDYYKIAGRTQLHRYMYNPSILATILNCYWRSDKTYILSVLVRSQTYTRRKQKVDMKKIARQFLGVAQNKAAIEVKIDQEYTDTDMSILDCMLNLSDDLLVNQILYMLSKLNIEYSFTLCKPQFKALCQYDQFQTYLNQWFTKTPQLEKVKVLQFDDNNEKSAEYRSNMTLLDKEFFKEYPPPNSNHQKTAQDQQIKGQKVLRPVNVRVMSTKWFTEPEGVEFFDALQDSENLALFDNTDLQAMIDFRWNKFLNYYRNIVFWPFMFMAYIPYTLFILMAVGENSEDQTQEITSIGWITVSLLWSYILYSIWWEVKEFKAYKGDWMGYLSDAATMFNYAALITIILSTTLAVTMVLSGLSNAENPQRSQSVLRIIFLIGVFELNAVLMYYIHVFDFWSTFVRGMVNIVWSALPLGACLFIFVFAQTLMFYILHQNQSFKREDEGKDGFWIIFINSYRFTLGDFQITDNFQLTGDNSDKLNMIVFWIVFVFGTVIQLLIILNMVIAVMSTAFDEVTQTNTANIYKAKLQCLQSYNAVYMDTAQFKNEIEKNHYLFLMNIDPVVTDLGPTLMSELPAAQVTNEIARVQKLVQELQIQMFSMKNGQIILNKKVESQFQILDQQAKEHITALENVIAKIEEVAHMGMPMIASASEDSEEQQV